MIVIFIAIFAYVVPVFVCAVAISIPIADLSGAAIIAIMIVPPTVVGVMVVSPAVVSVMVIPDDAITEARVVMEARIVSEACFILPSPFPIFPLALTVEPVVLDIVVPALGKPFPVIWIVVPVVAGGAVIRIVSPIPVLGASRSQNRPSSES